MLIGKFWGDYVQKPTICKIIPDTSIVAAGSIRPQFPVAIGRRSA
jgi:hypothetical protein